MTRERKFYRFSKNYPDPLRGPWSLTFHFTELNGIAECVGLDVRSFKEGTRSTQLTPLTASLVRSLPVGQLTSTMALEARDLLQWTAAGSKGANPKAKRAAKTAVPAFERRHDKRGTGRNYWTKERLEEVAEVYADAWRLKQRPTKAVAESFDLSLSMAAKLVRRCREAGLLGETTPGKAGGLAPPKRKKGS